MRGGRDVKMMSEGGREKERRQRGGKVIKKRERVKRKMERLWCFWTPCTPAGATNADMQTVKR